MQMPPELIDVITSEDPAVRDRSLDAFCRGASLDGLLAECETLDAFRRRSTNLYQRVRALFFLYDALRLRHVDDLRNDEHGLVVDGLLLLRLHHGLAHGLRLFAELAVVAFRGAPPRACHDPLEARADALHQLEP